MSNDDTTKATGFPSFHGTATDWPLWKSKVLARASRSHIAIAFSLLSPEVFLATYPRRGAYRLLEWPGINIVEGEGVTAAAVVARRHDSREFNEQESALSAFLNDLLDAVKGPARDFLVPLELAFQISLPTAMAALERNFGTVTPAILAATNAQLLVPFSGASIALFIHEHSMLHTICGANGDRHDPHPQCLTLMAACATHPYFGPVVARFRDLNTTIATQTFTALADYLIAAAGTMPPAPTITAGALGFTAAASAPHAAPTYADLQAELTALRAKQAKRQGPPKVCTYHPHLKSHTTAECSLNPDNAGKTPRPGGRAPPK